MAMSDEQLAAIHAAAAERHLHRATQFAPAADARTGEATTASAHATLALYYQRAADDQEGGQHGDR